jgi:hypothetical protein
MAGLRKYDAARHNNGNGQYTKCLRAETASRARLH